MTDAVENAMKMDGYPEKNISTAKMRKIAIPELGNSPMASFASCKHALTSLKLPYDIEDVTSKFQGGPPMLNLLRAKSGVYVVGLLVESNGRKDAHCIAYSATSGKLMDNGSRTLPVYIEDKDLSGKKAARNAFRTLIGQKCASAQFSVDVTEVYKLVRLTE